MLPNSRTRISFNAISAAIQTIIVGLVYFFVYKVLIVTIGIELLGVWSLIIMTSSFTNLANFGFTSALVKFVAEYIAKGEIKAINSLLFTSIMAMIVFFILVITVVYILAFYFIGEIIELRFVEIALKVLPLSLLCLFINAISGILTSALDGFQLNYLRNLIYSVTSVLYLGLTIFLVPEFGLVGLALAQVIQSLIILISAYYFLKSRYVLLDLFRWRWDQNIFKTLFNYGYKIQVISVAQLFIEPVTKIFISKYSGISTLGFYEMASRLIIQLRQVIVNMNQVTIPVVSHYFHTDKKAIRYIYERSLSFIVFIVFPLVAGIMLFTPFLSKIWIGYTEAVFVNCSYILALSMLVNILATPAYFNSMGEGNLNGILLMSIFNLVINAVLGVILGLNITDYGAVIALGVAYASGSVFLIIYYQARNHISLKSVLKKPDYFIMLGSLIFSVLTGLFFLRIGKHYNYNIGSLVTFLAAYAIFFIPIVYFNPNFKLLAFLKTRTKVNDLQPVE